MRLRGPAFVAIVAHVLLTGCAPTAEEAAGSDAAEVTAAETKFDSIDAAMLFPLKTATLTLADNPAGANKVTLLATTQFNQARALVEHESAPAYASWRIVAFRFDPCATTMPAGTDCTATIRLVAQPLGPGGADDHALHLIYKLATGEEKDVVKELADFKARCQEAKKVATNGTPVGVHPCFTLTGGKDKPFVTSIADLIVKHASQEKLVAISAMFTQGTQDNWFFGGGLVVNGNVQQIAIPGLVDPKVKDPKQGFHQTFTDPQPLPLAPRNGTIRPTTVDPTVDRIGVVAVNEQAVRKALGAMPPVAGDVKAIQDGIHAAVRITNPMLHNVRTATCADCHMGSRSVAMVKRVAGAKFDSLFDVKTDAFVPPDGVTATVPGECGTGAKSKPCRAADETDYIVKAFAYHRTEAVIIPRVANEAAKVAGFINHNLLPPR